ncbi:MAG TPA: hypothetical protein VF646_01360 [Cytophagales bacterium]
MVLVAATIVAEALIVQTANFRQHPNLLAFAVTFDLTIGIPLAYYLIISRKLRVTPLSTLVVFLLCTVLVGFILPAAHHTYLRLAEKALVLTEGALLVYGVVQIRKLVRAYQTAARHRADFLLNLRDALGHVFGISALLPIAVHEISTIRYGLLCWVGGKEVLPEQKFFTTHKESGYVAVWAVLLFVMVVETVGLHFLLWRWSPAAAYASTAVSIYSLVFFVADLASMVKRPIVLHAGQFLFRVGIRWNATIARENVRRLTVIKDFDKKKEKDTLLCAPANVPNLLLELHEPVVVTGFFGIRRQTQRIAFHADAATELIREVAGEAEGNPVV